MMRIIIGLLVLCLVCVPYVNGEEKKPSPEPYVASEAFAVGETLTEIPDGMWVGGFKRSLEDLYKEEGRHCVVLLALSGTSFSWKGYDVIKSIVKKYKQEKTFLMILSSRMSESVKESRRKHNEERAAKGERVFEIKDSYEYVLENLTKLKIDVSIVTSIKLGSRMSLARNLLEGGNNKVVLVIDNRGVIVWIGAFGKRVEKMIDLVVKKGAKEENIEVNPEPMASEKFAAYLDSAASGLRVLAKDPAKLYEFILACRKSLPATNKDENIKKKLFNILARIVPSAKGILKKEAASLYGYFDGNKAMLNILQKKLFKSAAKGKKADVFYQRKLIQLIAQAGQFDPLAATILYNVFKRANSFPEDSVKYAILQIGEVRDYKSMELLLNMKISGRSRLGSSRTNAIGHLTSNKILKIQLKKAREAAKRKEKNNYEELVKQQRAESMKNRKRFGWTLEDYKNWAKDYKQELIEKYKQEKAYFKK